jgi:serine/threonine protein kinase
VIAKLSDFGFSLDISQQKGVRSLVGFTPLWAAPECIQDLSPEGLQLTDVYSLGFIVWSVAICGRNPFTELQEQFGEESSTDDQVGMFNFLKDANEILKVAISHVEVHAGDLPDDIFTCCTFLTHTLQLDPAQRSLLFLLEGLRKESFRRNDEHIILGTQYAPLAPFDIHQVSWTDNQACHTVMSANTTL